MVSIEEDERAFAVGDLCDCSGILLDAVAIADVGQRHESCAFVDQLLIAAQWNAAPGSRYVYDLCAAGCLGVPDLGHSREGEVVYDNLVAWAAEVDGAGEAADRL